MIDKTHQWKMIQVPVPTSIQHGVPAAEVDILPPGRRGTTGGVQQVRLNATGIIFPDGVVQSEDVAGLSDAGGTC